MRIQNQALAGAKLSLRYSRDPKDPSIPLFATGDAMGCFDVPEADAELLLATPGWRTPKATPEASVEAPKAAPAPKAALKVAEPEAAPEEPEEGEEPEDEAAEKAAAVAAIRTKADAFKVARKYGVKLVFESTLKEMKRLLLED